MAAARFLVFDYFYGFACLSAASILGRRSLLCAGNVPFIGKDDTAGAITIGTRLGDHEITALLGKGGMGEKYHVRDAKLKRELGGRDASQFADVH